MKNTITIIALLLLAGSCQDFLEEETPSQFTPEVFFADEEQVESVLFSAYERGKFRYEFHWRLFGNYEYPADILFQTGGGINQDFVLMSQFNWTPDSRDPAEGIWLDKYASIRNANIVLDNLDIITDTEKRDLLRAEARFIRAMGYYYLYDGFGPVPLRTSADDPPALGRADEETLLTFIETEFREAAEDLPAPGDEDLYGRATKGAALGYLTRFLLNTKQFPKAAEAAQQVIDLNYYSLFPSYRDLFKVENEPDKNALNREMIFVSPCLNLAPAGNAISAPSIPPGFSRAAKLPEFEWQPGIANWQAQFRFLDSFINTFDRANDRRFDLIIDSYENRNGNMIDLTTQPNNHRTLKYFDNQADAFHHGNDFPLLRYADILLMRAEALNEVNGPSAEAVDLINTVRNRAGLADLSAGNFSTETLRDHILMERGWEFYYEGHRRSDLIRHGKFISSARERGVANAQDFHVLFPIPQVEMDANPNITENNRGY